MADPTGKSISTDARAKRARDIELLKLRHPPLSAAEQRAVDIARFKA
jgi:hypothetical protein